MSQCRRCRYLIIPTAYLCPFADFILYKKLRKRNNMFSITNMRILAIETSCDETGVAVLEKKDGNTQILGNALASQVKIHKKYGGVYPALARREHTRNLVPALQKALRQIENKELKIKNKALKTENLEKILSRHEALYKNLKEFLSKDRMPEIDAIAVTIGPGLEPCLWVGVIFAKALASYWNLPIIPVNHMEGHILANFIVPMPTLPFAPSAIPALSSSPCSTLSHAQDSRIKNMFPAACLLVSGGHTELVLMKNIGDYKILGETRDDAAGECFDKTARMLGLPYPGGPAIAAEAAKFPISNFQFSIDLPRPMINSKNYDFSFSGLKTAVLYKHKQEKEKIKASPEYIQAMAIEIQQAIVDILVKKTIKAGRDLGAKSIILGGGVAANKKLRSALKEKSKEYGLALFAPKKELCTDNAIMIAAAALCHTKNMQNWKKIKVDANLRIESCPDADVAVVL